MSSLHAPYAWTHAGVRLWTQVGKITDTPSEQPLVLWDDALVAARAVVSLGLGTPGGEVLALLVPSADAPSDKWAAPWRLWLQLQAHYFKGDLQVDKCACCL